MAQRRLQIEKEVRGSGISPNFKCPFAQKGKKEKESYLEIGIICHSKLCEELQRLLDCNCNLS